MLKKKWLIGIAILIIAVLAFTGCSGKKDSGGDIPLNRDGVPVSIGRADPATDFNYRLNEDGDGVIITRYTGSNGNVVIPGEIDGYPVVELGRRAFYGELSDGTVGPGIFINSVVIPASVKKIGNECFLRIRELNSVTILGRGVEIGRAVFSNNRNLTELNLLDGEDVLIPSEIPNNAFNACRSLPLPVRSKLVSWGFNEP